MNNLTRSNITLKKAKKLIKLKQFDKFYRNSEMEQKYQNRDQSKDPINKRDKSTEWKINNFPYQWEEGIERWMLWYHGDWKEFEQNYTKWIPANYSLTWINPPEKRSISNLPHAHALVKNKIKNG